MASRKDIMFQSEEAKAVSRASREYESITDKINAFNTAVKNINNTFKDANNGLISLTAAQKKELQAQKKAIQAKINSANIEQKIAEARKQNATQKFNQTNNTNYTSSEIEQNANTDDENSKKPSTLNKTASLVSSTLSTLINAATRLATVGLEKEYEAVSTRVDTQMADIKMLSEKALMGANLRNATTEAAVNSSVTTLTSGINEGAYAAANSMIDIGVQKKIMDLRTKQLELENKNTKALRTEQQNAKYSNLTTERNQALTTMGSEGVRIAGHALNNVEGLSFSAGEAPGAIADMVAGTVQGLAAANTAAIQGENRLVVFRYENEKKVTEAQLDSTTKVEEANIKAAANIEKAWLKFAQQMENNLLKSEAAANDLGISFGLNGQELENFKKVMLQNQISVAKWGKTLEDVQRVQLAYQDNTSRNIQLSESDLNSTFALDKLAGQDGLSSELTSSMEIFNHSVSDSNEMFYEMYKNVSKIGLNGRKYLKDLNKNLKLAEKYQFKNGIKGLMEMAKWAQNTRFNIDSAEKVIENFREGGIAGAVTKAAGMQVLGGNFAMGADPLAMFYEAYMDPQALMQRQNQMMKGIGKFNSKTGEVDFNMPEMMQLEQFAKLSGQSVNDLMNQRRQAVKGNKVEQQLNRGIKWSDEDKSLITNKAKLVNGEWKVTMENGVDKSVSQLTQEDLNNLKPTDNEEKLVNYVYDIRDMMTRLTGVKQEANATLESSGYEQWRSEEEQRMANVISDFNTNYQTYLSEFKEKMGLATESQKTLLDTMAAGNEDVAKASEQILQEGQNIANTLSQVNEMIKKSLNEIITNESYKPKAGEIAYEKPHAEIRGFAWHPADAAMKAWNDVPLPTVPGNDVIVNGNNKSMFVKASGVKTINDGVVKTNPQDTGMFAKNGGPFDKLFTGVFNRIDDVYNSVRGGNTQGKMNNQVVNSTVQPNTSSDKLFTGVFNRIDDVYNSVRGGRQEISLKPLEIKFNGNIRLESSNGQSVDLTNVVKNNPMFVRQLSQMLSEEIGNRINGGKSQPNKNYI